MGLDLYVCCAALERILQSLCSRDDQYFRFGCCRILLKRSRRLRCSGLNCSQVLVNEFGRNTCPVLPHHIRDMVICIVCVTMWRKVPCIGESRPCADSYLQPELCQWHAPGKYQQRQQRLEKHLESQNIHSARITHGCCTPIARYGALWHMCRFLVNDSNRSVWCPWMPIVTK